MSATQALRVCLGWYIVFLLSATLTSMINLVIPLGLFSFPITYALHAVFGIVFICMAEQVSPVVLWKKISPESGLSWIPRGLRFTMLALASVLCLALILSPFMPQGDPPQKELMDIIRSTKGIFPFVLIFATLALLAPVFEEIFFRGFLMSVLGMRYSKLWALVFSSLIFGAIHFQLMALPHLTILGAVMGLAFLMSRDVKTAITVHACWNGGVFLFQRLLLG
jgi:membrane protease YdiL (CAAX protease family)